MFYYGVFIFFIAFVIIAALNILTGVFVEQAMTIGKNDTHGHIMEEVDRERTLVKDFARLFFSIKGEKKIDTNATISLEEFEAYMQQHGRYSLFWAPQFGNRKAFLACSALQVKP